MASESSGLILESFFLNSDERQCGKRLAAASSAMVLNVGVLIPFFFFFVGWIGEGGEEEKDKR